MPTVLVIDDHEVIAFSVQSAVPDWTVLYAADGVMGLDLFRRHSDTLDLVVLDIQMPYLDGRAVCVAIRSLRPSIPILPFTGYPDGATLALFAEFGCAPPLIKPIDPVTLAATLHHLVGQLPRCGPVRHHSGGPDWPSPYPWPRPSALRCGLCAAQAVSGHDAVRDRPGAWWPRP